MTLRRFEALLVIGRFGCDGVKGIDCVMVVRKCAFSCLPFLPLLPPPPPSPSSPPIVKVVGLMHAVFVCD